MILNKKKFDELINIKSTDTPCISIFIKTHIAGQNLEDQLRFKNAISEVHDRLVNNYEMDSKAAHQYMQSAYELLDNDNFWLHQSHGLAMFIGGGMNEHFTVPVAFDNFTYVGNRFHLSPMLPLLTGNDRFFILALSQNEVKFYEAREHSITPVIIKDLVPANMELALGEEYTKNLHHHSGQGAFNSPIFHGQGAGNDDKIKDLTRYFRQIDEGLMQMLHDEKAPLIFAGVDYLFPIYQSVNTYSNLMDMSINGNFENEDVTVLHERAWTVMQDFFKTNQTKMKEDFGGFLSEQKASFSITDVVPAAINGKVDTLWITKGYHTMGTFDKKTNSINIETENTLENECLIDRAAIATYKNGGEVYVVDRMELPRITANVNAIYRY